MSSTVLPAKMDKSSKVLDSDGDASNEESAGEMTWSKPNFTEEMIRLQIKNKKKRVHSSSFSHSGTNGLTVNGVPADRESLASALQKVQVSTARVPYSKNSKKSRNGHRPSPKKRNGKQLPRPKDDIEELELDHEDPDYDSEVNDPVVYEELSPVLSDSEFEEMVHSLLKEFYEHCQTTEVISALSEINLSSLQRRRLPYLAITLALQYKLSQCELTSKLLSDMYCTIVTPAQMQQGFHLVLEELPDIVLDVPKASGFVGRFIARAVADDVLPPRFVDSAKISFVVPESVVEHLHHHHNHRPRFPSDHVGSVDSGNGFHTNNSAPLSAPAHKKSPDSSEDVLFAASTSVSGGGGGGRATLRSNSGGDAVTVVEPSSSLSLTPGGGSSSGVSSAVGEINQVASPENDVVLQALNKAESLLILDHSFIRLDHIWGVKLGMGANKHLVKQICMLLREHLESDDVEEATRCLQELDSPHFHHEVVYQAILLVIEKNDDVTRERIAKLLDNLSRSVVITLDQLVKGVKRVYAELPDLQLDVPVAYVSLERFLTRTAELGFMPKKLVQEMPTKSRRRFVSEGDALHRCAHTYCD